MKTPVQARHGWGHPGDREERTEGRMAIDLSLFNNSVTTLIGHLTSYYGEEATLETYVICARVKSPDIPGGSAINWVVSLGERDASRRSAARGGEGRRG